MNELKQMLQGTPYVAYSYAYPHKTTYRPLTPAVPLRDLWADEYKAALFLYVHIPFCEMRCGFCNLLTTANPHEQIVQTYLKTLERQAHQVRSVLDEATFARLAIGGGTPTYLQPVELKHLFSFLGTIFSIDFISIPISVETSPSTADLHRLQVLREHNVDRISIGIQSFQEHEVKAIGRSQPTAEAHQALENIRSIGFSILNIDLMYGLPGQTVPSWLRTLQTALAYQPQELYLYPLYVRPLTGLERIGTDWDNQRLTLYRVGREFLLQRGYQQRSMRLFGIPHTALDAAPHYCCQEDGMVGLGCGARSYTHGLHYSNDYAVKAQRVRAIIADYINLPDSAFDTASYGIQLNDLEQRRRYIIKSLLRSDGLSDTAYHVRFGTSALDDFPQLAKLFAYGLAMYTPGYIHLTEAGIERSDTIGPWLYSTQVQTLMEGYALQ